MADYQIIRVCTPFVFFDIPSSFLEFIQPQISICPKGSLPIFLLIEKGTSKIIEVSYDYLRLFNKKTNLTNEDVEKLKANALRIILKQIDSSIPTIEPENYEINYSTDFKNEEQLKIIDEMKDEIILQLIKSTKIFRIESEKIKIQAELKKINKNVI